MENSFKKKQILNFVRHLVADLLLIATFFLFMDKNSWKHTIEYGTSLCSAVAASLSVR